MLGDLSGTRREVELLGFVLCSLPRLCEGWPWPVWPQETHWEGHAETVRGRDFESTVEERSECKSLLLSALLRLLRCCFVLIPVPA